MGNTQTNQRLSGRRITPRRAHFCRLAESARVGTITRAQLAVLVQSLPCIGLINGTESHLLVALINTAQADTFDKSGRPIVFKSNQQLAFEIGRSVGRVSRMLSRLFDAGLITMQDSGNYKRYPIRNGEGEITDGCGIDLRILIVRYAELDESVRQARAEKKAADTALRRYRGALRKARQALAVAAGHSERALARLAARIDRVSDLVGIAGKASSRMLRRATALLEWLVERLMQLPCRSKEAVHSQNMTCPYVENDMHKQITTPDPIAESNDERRSATAEQLSLLKAGSASKRAFEESLGRRRSESNQPQQLPRVLVALQDVLRAVPALKTYGFAPTSWADLARTVPLICRFAGISDDAHRRAVEEMGEQQAAVAVAVTLEKYERQEVSSPGGYLRAMTDRARAGELHLARSIYGLAARNSMEVTH
ncbi:MULTISPECIES: plasmid replication protein RepC [unclassified Rhizobium]|uniref:plasmid replication protein RepC n=1 Tax=unclassified Rhizobium TaxID=2613769 RepID=UPI001B332038|nr:MULTISPECIES: plasmid replication protein RepC [unclassified Rhizobium]MBX5260632.1 replication protein C [Rhizobium sp. NLR16b]MBX5266747.1 replication protein C [Rhizobium sp. NLR16a]MBX5297154.1 replication protein C [Rhizobium sp. NLR15a]MBX5315281.1 replication protein C [Rhizobium sp. NLR11b]QTV00885.1 replication protein C [Rhizobium sp. NLR16a]